MGSQGRMTMKEVVGFYGCALMDRPVRVHPPEDGKVPRVAHVRCPCGGQHKKGISWRPLGEDERLRAEARIIPKEDE